jgi:hypothetical protein
MRLSHTVDDKILSEINFSIFFHSNYEKSIQIDRASFYDTSCSWPLVLSISPLQSDGYLSI